MYVILSAVRLRSWVPSCCIVSRRFSFELFLFHFTAILAAPKGMFAAQVGARLGLPILTPAPGKPIELFESSTETHGHSARRSYAQEQPQMNQDVAPNPVNNPIIAPPFKPTPTPFAHTHGLTNA